VPYREETFFLDYFQKLTGCVFGTLAESAYMNLSSLVMARGLLWW
jgi:hypothetical protein